jgi:D-sedoheptulose 7-phosphate isomerase
MRLYAQEYVDKLKQMLDAIDPHDVERVTNIILDAYKNDKQVFIMGNGGSASAASHMACDLGKGTVIAGKKRFRVISLNDNMAVFSAIANDFGYENVFLEQIKNVLNPGDVVIGISASGNSPSVVNAMRYANQTGGITVAIVGFTGGEMKKLADANIHLQSPEYGPVEDGHMIINHMITTFLKSKFDFDHKIAMADLQQRIGMQQQSIGSDLLTNNTVFK